MPASPVISPGDSTPTLNGHFEGVVRCLATIEGKQRTKAAGGSRDFFVGSRDFFVGSNLYVEIQYLSVCKCVQRVIKWLECPLLVLATAYFLLPTKKALRKKPYFLRTEGLLPTAYCQMRKLFFPSSLGVICQLISK